MDEKLEISEWNGDRKIGENEWEDDPKNMWKTDGKFGNLKLFSNFW